jgi:hypothetical protein
LVDEIKPQDKRCDAVGLLDPTLNAFKRAGLDAHAHSLVAAHGHQPQAHICPERQKYIPQLPAKSFLVEYLQHIRDILVSTDGF